MEGEVFTKFSATELRGLFRQELDAYFQAIVPTALKNDQTEQLLTIEEAADFLKISINTIYGLTSKSEIPYCKKSKRLYFSKQELTDWVKQGRKKTNSETAAEAEAYMSKKRK